VKTTVGHQNAYWLAKRFQSMEEELAIGRELQMSMLPLTSPETEGFEIAASQTPPEKSAEIFMTL